MKQVEKVRVEKIETNDDGSVSMQLEGKDGISISVIVYADGSIFVAGRKGMTAVEDTTSIRKTFLGLVIHPEK
jgi:hypothetical protein